MRISMSTLSKMFVGSLFALALSLTAVHAQAATILALDFQASGNNNGTASGFTAFNVTEHPGVSTNPSLGDFSITGDVSGFNSVGSADPLFGDIFFFGVGNATNDPISFSITNLSPSTEYKLTLFGGTGGPGARAVTATVGLDSVMVTNAAGTPFATGSVFSDINGDIIGTFAATGSNPEGNLSGIQLDSIVPEPSTLVLAAFGLIGLALGRRRRRV